MKCSLQRSCHRLGNNSSIIPVQRTDITFLNNRINFTTNLFCWYFLYICTLRYLNHFNVFILSVAGTKLSSPTLHQIKYSHCNQYKSLLLNQICQIRVFVITMLRWCTQYNNSNIGSLSSDIVVSEKYGFNF